LKPITRRGFLKALGYGTVATTISPNFCFSNQLPENSSEIFHIKDINFPKFADSNHHPGVDALISLMGNNGSKFYETNYSGLNGGHQGFIARDDVVLIKVNGQWRCRGATNSDVLRGIIQLILDHPEGFAGEIIIIENGQSQGSMDGTAGGWGSYPGLGIQANAENPNHTYNFIANEVFHDYPVSTYLMDSLKTIYVDEDDHVKDGYRKLGVVSYPCFTSKLGNRIELAKGIWKNGLYHNNLKLINLPVLKTHGGSGITGALKHTYGILTMDYQPIDYHYSELGRAVGSMFAFALPPTLNIMDMIWISHKALSGYPENKTSRQNQLAASFDPVALDFYSCKYVMYPVSNNVNHHPEMTDKYTNSNFGFQIVDAANIINENGGLMGKRVNYREPGMSSVAVSNPVQVKLKLNRTELLPGSQLNVSYRIFNQGFSKDVDFYFAIKIGESYYFYPNWETTPTPNLESLKGNSNPAFGEILSLPISDKTPGGKYSFAAAVTDRGTTNVLGFIDYQEFEIKAGRGTQGKILEAFS